MKYTRKSGDWNKRSTWRGFRRPKPGDDVYINADHTVRIREGEVVSVGILDGVGTLSNAGTLSVVSLWRDCEGCMGQMLKFFSPTTTRTRPSTEFDGEV